MTSAYHKIPQESRELLELALRLLKSPLAPLSDDEVVLMIYNLGRSDGRIQQLDLDEAMVREELANAYAETMLRRDQAARHEGKPHNDLDPYGGPLKAGT